ncbi:protein of unknown function [Modestobacter italicus]|uniref:Uncharacterized protein n=1 Tax=Modestobacter italicus (strain DSM 44449 / CECT 9708 / BC 501) TaxID=2732864 RepID=I4ESQ6_MODI5|nr:protein of unknown function [Modestobacter marinus]
MGRRPDRWRGRVPRVPPHRVRPPAQTRIRPGQRPSLLAEDQDARALRPRATSCPTGADRETATWNCRTTGWPCAAAGRRGWGWPRPPCWSRSASCS